MIKEIVTHGCPAHYDELTGIILLQDYGEEKYPGVKTATVRYITAQDSLEELSKRPDVLLIGLGGGIFDEHTVDGDNSKKTECAVTLVAKNLGLDQDARWTRILKDVLHTDKNMPTLAAHLARIVMALQEQGARIQDVLVYTKIGMQALYGQQVAFYQTPVWNITHSESIEGRHGDIELKVVKDDNPQSSKLARLLGADIVVAKNTSGHVQILTSNSKRLPMREVVAVLRTLEQRAKGGINKVGDWSTLRQEGSIAEIPEWFFHEDSNNILNGGRSRPDLPSTKLSLTAVIGAVKTGLEPNRFFPQYAEKCRQGICSSSLRTPCPWYAMGLSRCRDIRRKAKGRI